MEASGVLFPDAVIRRTALEVHAGLPVRYGRRGLRDGEGNGLMRDRIDPGHAGAFQTPHGSTLRAAPVRGEFRGVLAVFRDEHGIDPQDASVTEDLLVLRLQDQCAVEGYPGNWFLCPGTVGALRGRCVAGQIGEGVPAWDDQPEGEQEAEVRLLGSAKACMMERSG